MHPKVFVKLKKPSKPSLLGKKPQKKTKKPKKPQKTHWAGFFKNKTRVFSNPAYNRDDQARNEQGKGDPGGENGCNSGANGDPSAHDA